jgi:heme exporter protein D
MLGQVLTNTRALLGNLLLALGMVGCLVWLAFCLALLPILIWVRRGRRKVTT